MLLDLNRKQASLDEQPLALTAYEYRILEYLMRHHQQVVDKDRLMEQLYPDDDERDPNVIEVLVGRLRRTLGLGMDHLDPPTHRLRTLGLMFRRTRRQPNRRMHLLHRRLHRLLQAHAVAQAVRGRVDRKSVV